MTRSAADARRAIAAAPRSAAGHVALAYALHSLLDLPGAYAANERAYQVGRGDPRALWQSAEFLSWMGRFDEALERLAQARALDPLDPANDTVEAAVLLSAHRYEEGAAAARRALERTPRRGFVRIVLGDCLLMLGRTAEAQAVYEQLPAGHPYRPARLAVLKARTDDRAGSDRILAELKTDETMAFQWAEIHAQQGEADAAFQALETALRLGDPGLITLRTDPFLEPLHKDPRFAALEKSLRFPGRAG